jgi:hypothetical protein
MATAAVLSLASGFNFVLGQEATDDRIVTRHADAFCLNADLVDGHCRFRFFWPT